MDLPKADKHKIKLLKKCSNLKNESSSENALTNMAGTSNGRSTSAKSKESTEKRPQKRTISHSQQGKSVKRLKQTSTTGDHTNGVASTSKINPTLTLERCDREVNMAELNSKRNTTTLRNKSHEVADTSTTSSQDSEQTVNATENIQNVLQTSQNTNNAGDNLIDDSIRIAGEIPASNRKRKNNSIPLTDNNIIIAISEDDAVYDGPSTSSSVRRKTTTNSKNEGKTNKRKKNNETHTETQETTTVIINEEKDDNQVELSSEGLSTSCPICYEPLKNKEMSSTTCGHVFCKGCLLAAIKTSKKCPTCRTPLTKKKIHPIFI